MNKLILLTLLISTQLFAYNPFYNDVFNNRFNDRYWQDFNRHFANRTRELRQNNNDSNFQSRKYVKDGNYVIDIKINNLNKDNITISTTNNNMLTISGNSITEKKSDNSYSNSSSSFFKSLSLPKDANKNKLNTSFNNNILTIVIPKITK